MKIKADFVTNSSSLSYIIENCDDTRVVALAILEYILEGDSDPYKKDGKFVYDSLNRKIIKYPNKSSGFYAAIKNVQNIKSPDTNICIPFSCNYETFIYRMENGDIYVDTCNNYGNVYEDMEGLDVSYVPEDEEITIPRREVFVDVTDGKHKRKIEYSYGFKTDSLDNFTEQRGYMDED